MSKGLSRVLLIGASDDLVYLSKDIEDRHIEFVFNDVTYRVVGDDAVPEFRRVHILHKDECPNKVFAFRTREGEDVFRKCGAWAGGEQQFCDAHQAYYEELYPQGWRGYPGDVCAHGTYVGGCGADHMCGPCEGGDTERETSEPLVRWIEAPRKWTVDEIMRNEG